MATLAHRRPTRFGLATLAVLPLLAGCAWEDAAFKQTTTIKAPSAPSLKVDARNGAIHVHTGTGSEVVIEATVKMTTQERLGQVTLVADKNTDGVLEVYAKPPEGGWKSSEGCAFDVAVPSAAPVALTTDNGSIHCEGMKGRGVFETSNGSVHVIDHDGTVKIGTSNGRIEVTGATGAVESRTSNGSVTVRLAAANTGPVVIRTSNGSVTLDLGSGFRGRLGVQTSNGSISLPSAAEGLTVNQSGHNSATVTVGQGGPDSSIETSNGSVTVRR
jgi:hypothetical protein